MPLYGCLHSTGVFYLWYVGIHKNHLYWYMTSWLISWFHFTKNNTSPSQNADFHSILIFRFSKWKWSFYSDMVPDSKMCKSQFVCCSSLPINERWSVFFFWRYSREILWGSSWHSWGRQYPPPAWHVCPWIIWFFSTHWYILTLGGPSYDMFATDTCAS